MLRKHARRTASVIGFLTRQEGNTIVRGQQEQLAVTRMVNEGESIRVTPKRPRKKKQEIQAMKLEDEPLSCTCRARKA